MQYQQPQPPQQAQPAQQAQQPQQAYSNEQEMVTHAEAGSQTVTTVLDAEAFKIIQQASQLHGEAIINLGIKMLAKTNMYKEFMLKPEFKTLDVATENIADAVDLSPKIEEAVAQSSSTSSTPEQNQSASSAAPANTFNSW